MAYVYILKSLKNNKFYIGSTDQPPEVRLKRHNAGYVHSTKRLVPLKLVFDQQVENISTARAYERKLKNYKRRDFIEKIVADGIIRSTLK